MRDLCFVTAAARVGCRTVACPSRLQAVSARRLHASSACRALPVPSSVESAASKWTQSRINPNSSSALSNLPLSLALLQAAHRIERDRPSAARSSNIVINPVSVALQLQDSAQSRRALLSAMPRPLTEEQLDTMLRETDHSRIGEELSAANSEFAEWNFTPPRNSADSSGSDAHSASSSSSSSSASSSPSHSDSSSTRPSSSFRGYLSPRFALTKTVSPSWFIPTPTSAQQSAYAASRLQPLPYRSDDTSVTAVERSVRVAARMLYRTGKLWYVESTLHQMVDVPYLHPHYSLTLLNARWTDAPSIDEHPQLAYGNVKRERSDIHTVLARLSAQQLVHDMRYMALLPGLLVMPAFDAHYTLQLGGGSGGLSDASRLAVSGAGLQSGGLKTLSHRPGRPFPNFLLSAHRPFIFVVRHRPTNHVALIGLVENVEVDPTEYKYKTRKVQWLEDSLPIQQF